MNESSFAGPSYMYRRMSHWHPANNETDRLLPDLSERVRNLGIENAALRERLENQGQRSSNRNRVLACSFDIEQRINEIFFDLDAQERADLISLLEQRRNPAQAPRS